MNNLKTYRIDEMDNGYAMVIFDAYKKTLSSKVFVNKEEMMKELHNIFMVTPSVISRVAKAIKNKPQDEQFRY